MKNLALERDLKEKMRKTSLTNYALFEEIFENVLQRHVPKKKKVQRASHKPYVTKAMRKAIMKRSQARRQGEARGEIAPPK